MGSRKKGYQSIAKRLGLMRRRAISSSEKRELHKHAIGCFCSGGWKLQMTSAGVSFLTEVGSKAILLNVMNQDPSYSFWSTHLEIIKTTLSGVVLLYLAERCGSGDSEQFSDLSEVTQEANVRVWTASGVCRLLDYWHLRILRDFYVSSLLFKEKGVKRETFKNSSKFPYLLSPLLFIAKL